MDLIIFSRYQELITCRIVQTFNYYIILIFLGPRRVRIYSFEHEQTIDSFNYLKVAGYNENHYFCPIVLFRTYPKLFNE